MSRIEKALEKAGKMRETADEGIGAQEAAVPPVSPETFRAEVSVHPDSPYLVTLNDPNSPIAEEYRKLKSMVVKFTNSGKFHNTIMVTSTLGGEGKSITSLNLAITLAQEYDHTVMLVDADLRQPSLHSYLGVEPTVGLSDCLTEGVDMGTALIKTGIGKLTFLPAGTRVSNPTELLSSGRMKEFVAEIKNRYPDRYIILDTPPVLLFAEAHTIGSVVDGVIFVVREEQAPLHDIREALGILKDANMLGVVYNGADVSTGDRHYYYGYGKYYGKRYGK